MSQTKILSFENEKNKRQANAPRKVLESRELRRMLENGSKVTSIKFRGKELLEKDPSKQ